MKKVISIILSMVLAISLAACGGSSGGADSGSTSDKKELIYPFGIVNRPIGTEGAYAYKTACYSDQTLETNGYVYIRDYTITPVEGEEGMVDKSITVGFIFNDYNAYSWGTMAYLLYSDIEGDGILGGSDEWTVDYNGKEYPITVIRDEFLARQWLANHVYVSFYNLTLRMPEGYDGTALFFYNAKNQLGICSDGELPDGTDIATVVDADTQWFVLGGEDGTYFDQPMETQQPQADPAAIIYDRLYQMDAPPPMPGDPVYEYLPDEPGETDNRTDAGNENTDTENPPEADTPEAEQDAPADPDGYTDNTEAWIELTDWTVDEIDGNTGYQPVNFFLTTHGWNEKLQTRYRSFSDTDGVIQEFILEAMEDGSVTMDITGTEITADSVCFEFTLLDGDGFELSMSKVDIPVTR